MKNFENWKKFEKHMEDCKLDMENKNKKLLEIYMKKYSSLNKCMDAYNKAKVKIFQCDKCCWAFKSESSWWRHKQKSKRHGCNFAKPR